MDHEQLIPPTPSDEDYRAEAGAQEAFAVDEDQGKVFTNDDPLELFSEWLTLAKKHEPNDANAMSLATVDSVGMPDVRIVLLKDLDDGFIFYTNATSAKGEELAANPLAALCFHWKTIRRQVRVRGLTEAVSNTENDAYFASRSRGSQIGAWASQQSKPMSDDTILKTRVEDYESIYDGRDVPRPEFWRGYRLIPSSIEFWVNRPYRLHDRLLFQNDGDGWTQTILYP
ncbi:pyridoxamine 5'-phosphate oxidase [Parvularcula sp. LCG005]|uniref:pyridoxamine 5'-phosphate oxidase n=1 Tax=Parvularcula sp. LCG005 TaxID=3078805 RepID=UPI002942671D|nr:pyridoxamine 5'-phosphate oxidase [Parvularcula sp. LCG005]WOI52633.1 pyridoxamine 5'-phosphate oxidase [Parvularcula sp. LCG005]